MIRFRAVTKTYGDAAPAVRNLDLDIERGSITVFVGPSGCGKTTSLRMINRMVEPTSGSIEVDGVDISTVKAAQLRRSMGYVMQSSGLLPHRTVLDNVATVPRLNGTPRRDARRRAAELLDVVGLDPTLGNRYPAQLSGGQQQRVGVARALASDPPVLLMDEPFSAVDPVVRAELQEELLRLQQDLSKTIVFVTHDIDEATILGDKVAVFATGGRLAQYAAPEEILRAPVDDFVAGFVGRDRGFRHLSFQDGTAVPVHPVQVIAAERLPDPAARVDGSWALCVDADGAPLGWVPADRRDAITGTSGLVPGGSLYPEGTSLRRALDAALSSPSGLGVAVDADGRVTGVVQAAEILGLIEAARLQRTGS
ncbi:MULTISPECIES: ABC transporter ATP-binding protein [unclassified Arthrobacter]|uniref:ABC transporter ATP-binding protein n=1 Tax=unclassified Arthrobacter TaxID=235627 RepID=UPI001E4E4408|nr:MULTISPECIES: ABC transporter ATP-binding protein [unclassified Arthrobacter]MCC9144968.1 ABC transporter ATP-binding protein [Arthrobacter sp. zg-Y919]MDK1276196.1 ABC transporter ATP-binding protein [Arthrobacter sp. zg.Y919]MDM7989938.1 ABC transporter ATP-binding protein [Arthrobacter sp. zg-Y877]WIB04575.1 ABC transporter ATP-binding protein [Arthrobacter sp. zg-Y919]